MIIHEPTDETTYPTACEGSLREPGDYPSADYRGRRFYFCTKVCLRVFESDLDRFMAGEIEHPLEEE